MSFGGQAMNSWGLLQAPEGARAGHGTVALYNVVKAETQRMGVFGECWGARQKPFPQGKKGHSALSSQGMWLAGTPGDCLPHVKLLQSNSCVRTGWIVHANPNHRFPGNYFWSLLDLITQ